MASTFSDFSRKSFDPFFRPLKLSSNKNPNFFTSSEENEETERFFYFLSSAERARGRKIPHFFLSPTTDQFYSFRLDTGQKKILCLDPDLYNWSECPVQWIIKSLNLYSGPTPSKISLFNSQFPPQPALWSHVSLLRVERVCPCYSWPLVKNFLRARVSA